MSGIETENLIDVLKTGHCLPVLQAAFRRVEQSTEFSPDDDIILEINAMFQHRIDVELNAIAQPAD